MMTCKDDVAPPKQSCPSQLDPLKWLLPEYRWMLVHSAGTVTPIKSSLGHVLQAEGLGVISRRPIVSSNIIRMRQTSFRDLNKRIALHIKIKMESEKEEHDNFMDIVVVHFSYDPQQQCDNANDIIKYVNDAGLHNSIILGDFNVYDELSPAVGQFVGLPSGYTSCQNMPNDDKISVLGTFHDVWLSSGKSHQQGLSFSNMPTPGPQSRPDRILISKQIQVTEVGLVDHESDYWNHYHTTAMLHRARTVFIASYHSFIRLDGYSCLHDCGPHGSCRCGVCIKGGNHNNCHLPNCSECNSFKFIVFISLSFIVYVMFFILMLSVIRILVVSARFNQNDVIDILGYRCCLFNKQLFQFKFQVFPRRFRIRLISVLKLYNLPPAVVALASLILLCLIFFVSSIVFHEALNVILSILPEEKFPSDHKMIFSRVKLRHRS